MASQPNILDQSQLQSLVGWLEEQHRQDRQEIARLGSEIERLATHLREQGSQLDDLRATVDQDQSTVQRMPLVDDAVRQAREQIAELVSRFDEHAQKTAQALLLRSADAERDRKAVNDVAHAMNQVEHSSRAVVARVQVIADESRRDRAGLAEIPKAIEAVETRVGAFAHRAGQIEEVAKRLEAAAQQYRQEIEAIRTEQSRAAQWRQLTDLRWTRQVSEWQAAIDNWRQAAEEHARPVQHLLQQVTQAREETRATQGQLVEHARRIADAAAGAERFENALAQQRESIGRLEAAMDAQRRRFDEQASAQLRIDEAIGRVVDQRVATDRTLDDQRRQIDEVRTALRLTDAEFSRTRQEISQAHAGMQEAVEHARGLGEQALSRLDEAMRQIEARFGDISALLQSHRQRTIVDLEQQLRELADLAPSTRTG